MSIKNRPDLQAPLIRIAHQADDQMEDLFPQVLRPHRKQRLAELALDLKK